MYNLEKPFLEYSAKFDLNDSQIIRKRVHTIKTALTAVKIAKALGLDEENINLAYTIAMFHDIARFLQWTKFKTYTDAKSFDHGDKAVEILFDENLVESFNIDKKYYDVIKFAIKNHNKFKIDEKTMPTLDGIDVLLHAKIIRDADKIDIARQLSANPKEVGTIPRSDVKKQGSGVHHVVKNAIDNKRQVKYQEIQTISDQVIGSISMAYDLNTAPARKIFVKNNYPVKIFKSNRFMIPKEDRETVLRIAKKVTNDLKC
jgi:HD superfamily phosphohydrolase YqeK